MPLQGVINAPRLPRVAGLTGARTALVITRPCPTPYHPISDAGLIGGDHVPMPGQVSLAHHGVRCLDERPEFDSPVLSCGNRSRRVFYKYNLPHVVDLTALAALAELMARVLTATG